MKLLTFAHHGEAQHFIKHDNYKSVDFKINGLYKNENNYLLITGEGFESTNEKMNAFLLQPNWSISRVINLGIAGALDENLKIESIYSIKKIEKEKSDETFQSSDVYANIDCISSLNRVHNYEYSKQLAEQAQIVDRELWAIAKVCNSYQIQFYSFKLISDFAGENIDTQSIIKKSKEYSKKLFDFYHDNINKKEI